MVLDLDLRFRVHAADGAAEAAASPASSTSRPASARCRSTSTPRADRRDLLEAARARRRPARRPTSWRSRAASCTCRCRWDDPATREAIDEVHAGRCAPTRPGARATSSSSAASTASLDIDDVHRIVFDASYLVLGLGDVYLGAPVATPLDPRHRLVTTKYNPARTWTPENAVGIGGAYLCIYGMEGPGGYQFVGRTVQVWNRHRRSASSRPAAVAAALLRPDPLLPGGRRGAARPARRHGRAGRGPGRGDGLRRGRVPGLLADNDDDIAAFRARQRPRSPRSGPDGRRAASYAGRPSWPRRRRRWGRRRRRRRRRPAGRRAGGGAVRGQGGRRVGGRGDTSRPATGWPCSRP